MGKLPPQMLIVLVVLGIVLSCSFYRLYFYWLMTAIKLYLSRLALGLVHIEGEIVAVSFLKPILCGVECKAVSLRQTLNVSWRDQTSRSFLTLTSDGETAHSENKLNGE